MKLLCFSFYNVNILYLKRFLVIQNFSTALEIEFISFNLSSLEKGCLRFERFRLALFKNRR